MEQSTCSNQLERKELEGENDRWRSDIVPNSLCSDGVPDLGEHLCVTKSQVKKFSLMSWQVKFISQRTCDRQPALFPYLNVVLNCISLFLREILYSFRELSRFPPFSSPPRTMHLDKTWDGSSMELAWSMENIVSRIPCLSLTEADLWRKTNQVVEEDGAGMKSQSQHYGQPPADKQKRKKKKRPRRVPEKQAGQTIPKFCVRISM